MGGAVQSLRSAAFELHDAAPTIAQQRGETIFRGTALAALGADHDIRGTTMPNANFTEQDLLNAQVEKLHMEARKLEREIHRLDRPFWNQWSFWRSMLAAIAVGAAVWAGVGRFS